MPRARALVAAAAVLAGCRHHTPPEWTPSIHEPSVAAKAAPAAPPPQLAAWPPPPPPPSLRAAPPGPPPAFAPPPDAGVTFELRTARDGGTVNGHPRGPSAEALEAAVRAAAPELSRCARSESLPANVELSARASYKILPVGRTGTVEVQGPLPPDVMACVKGVLDGLRFPTFEGEPVSGALPFTIKREAP